MSGSRSCGLRLHRPWRIAFLTNEFATERSDAGGLGSYLDRISRALCERGHAVEVLTLTRRHAAGVLDRGGVRVQRIPVRRLRSLGALLRLARIHPRLALGETLPKLEEALSLGAALARREAETRFDLVQSTNCGLAGLFVRRDPARPHLLRLSSLRGLWWRAQGRPPGLDRLALERLEDRALRRADRVYAPSRFLAARASERLGREVALLRPPALLECEPAKRPSLRLPGRYLLHFGRLGPAKGTDLLLAALPLAWREAPDLCVVLAGRPERGFELEAWCRAQGARAEQVLVAGPLEKPELFAVLRGALASVLPSRVDNLPNAAIESLLLGVPVLGTQGASLEELVVPGRSGALVPAGDAAALARALVETWQGRPGWLGAGFERPPLLDALDPDAAAEGLLALAKEACRS
jgi:glycosyltransferase involved in cell wall biosynthesis